MLVVAQVRTDVRSGASARIAGAADEGAPIVAVARTHRRLALLDEGHFRSADALAEAWAGMLPWTEETWCWPVSAPTW